MSTPRLDSDDAATLAILIAHAQLQDALLQSYRQMYLGVQAVLLALGFGVFAALLTVEPARREYLLWVLAALTIIAFVCVWQLRSIVQSRARDVSFCHLAILEYESQLTDSKTRYFTRFKIQQEPESTKPQLEGKYLSDGTNESIPDFKELLGVPKGHTRRVLEDQLFVGAVVLWILLVAVGAAVVYRG